MKLFTATFFAVILLTLRAAVAQDPNMVPIPDNSATPPPGPPPVPLFPNENPPPVVNRPPHGSGGRDLGGISSSQPVAKKKLTTAENEQDIADRVKFREAKTKALRDPQVQAELANIQAAKNDVDQRAAWKRYYTLLYAKILKIDGSLKKLVAERLKNSLKSLDQSKVRPEDYPQQASAAH